MKRVARLICLVVSFVLFVSHLLFAQEATGSNFPNRYTGRQIIVTSGEGENRPEYRLLDNGLMFYRTGAEGPFQQLGQQTKELTLGLFQELEQEQKIKTAQAEKPEDPDTTVTWKKAKTEYVVGWEGRKAPEGFLSFYERFLKIFPKNLR